MEKLLLIFFSDTNSLIMYAAFEYHTIFLLSQFSLYTDSGVAIRKLYGVLH